MASRFTTMTSGVATGPKDPCFEKSGRAFARLVDRHFRPQKRFVVSFMKLQQGIVGVAVQLSAHRLQSGIQRISLSAGVVRISNDRRTGW